MAFNESQCSRKSPDTALVAGSTQARGWINAPSDAHSGDSTKPALAESENGEIRENLEESKPEISALTGKNANTLMDFFVRSGWAPGTDGSNPLSEITAAAQLSPE